MLGGPPAAPEACAKAAEHLHQIVARDEARPRQERRLPHTKNLVLHAGRGPRGETEQVLEIRTVAGGGVGRERCGPLNPPRLSLRSHGSEHQAFKTNRRAGEATKELGLGRRARGAVRR